MTSGDLTVEQAMKFQTFTNVKNCVPSKVKLYKAKRFPTCRGGYGCGACWDKWIKVNT